MNLTKAQKARLGVFVLTGGLVLFGALFSLAGMKVLERRDTYTVRFTESVSGLEVSAQVKYQGFRVGRVEAMRVAADDPAAIEVDLAIDPGTVLYEGTTVTLDASGITGLKNINISAGDPRKPKIPPGSRLPVSLSFFDRLTGKAEEISVKVEVVANNLAVWTGEDNRRRVERLLDSLDKLSSELSTTLAETRDPMVRALDELARTGVVVRESAVTGTKVAADVGGELSETLKTTRRTIGEVERLLKAVETERIRSIAGSADSALKKVDQRLSDAELGVTIQRLSTALAEITKLLEEMDLVVRAGREDFVTSLHHVRQATEDLREFSRIVAQDPSVLLRGTKSGE